MEELVNRIGIGIAVLIAIFGVSLVWHLGRKIVGKL
jgi:hypothetical protein